MSDRGIWRSCRLWLDRQIPGLWIVGIGAIPKSFPLANVLSIGDVVIALGAAFTIHRVTGSRFAGRSRPAAD